MAAAAEEGKLKRSILLAGQLGLTALVTWFIVDRLGPGLGELGRLDAGAWTPDPGLFIASCSLLLFGYFVSAALWGRLVTDLGGPPLPAMAAVGIFMVANVGRYVPGKLWQIAGLAVLAKRRGVPAATATAAAVLGQAMGLVAATLVGLGALSAAPDAVRRWGVPAARLLTGAAVVALLPSAFNRLASLAFRLARRDAPAGLDPGRAVVWLGLYVGNWLVYAFSFWVLAASLGVQGSPVAVGSAFAAAYVLGYLMIFAPAGVGVREGFLVTFLAPVMGVQGATVLAVVSRLWTTMVELIPAALFWVRELAAARETTSAGGDDGD